jgi:lauroyl/myristoyl acyltransferase
MNRYIGLVLASRLLGKLPTSILYGLGFLGGQVAYLMNRRGRNAVLENLRHVMPQASEAERRRVVRKVFVNVTRFYADFIQVPNLDLTKVIHERISFLNVEKLYEARSRGKGVILTSFHYGTPELAFHCFLELGDHGFVFTEPLKPPMLSDIVHGLRNSKRRIFEPVGVSSLKLAVRTLRRGQVVAIMADRDLQKSGVCVPFFSACARMPVGAIELAAKTGATILPVVTRRAGGNRIEIEFADCLELSETGDKRSDLTENVRRLLSIFETQLRRDPSQWLVLEPLWKGCASEPHCHPVEEVLHGTRLVGMGQSPIGSRSVDRDGIE